VSDGLVYGLHAVRTLLQRHPGRVRQLWLQAGREDARAGQLRRLAEEHGVRVATRPATELDRMVAGGAHQGVVAETAAAAAPDEDDLPDIVRAAGKGVLLLVLDGVQDPHNLGACLRTADAAGVHAVIAPRDRAAGLTPVARKVAAGAAETVPFIQVTNLARTLARLKELGVWLVGAAGQAEVDLYQADLKGPLAVVMGSEGTGLRRLTREACDFTVRLPMRGVVESLNVSVATGIVLYEALRQRG
jgi:23S rRNA (guanosine2251-2'-O)-methyltransferase